MEYYLTPKLQEIEQRIRLSREILLILQEYLRESLRRGNFAAPTIGDCWTLYVDSQKTAESTYVYAPPSTEHGVPIENYIRVGLFIASGLNEGTGTDITPVLDILVGENGTVVSGPATREAGRILPDGSYEEDHIAVSFIELNADELAGLKADLLALLA